LFPVGGSRWRFARGEGGWHPTAGPGLLEPKAASAPRRLCGMRTSPVPVPDIPPVLFCGGDAGFCPALRRVGREGPVSNLRSARGDGWVNQRKGEEEIFVRFPHFPVSVELLP
jgi:hypothetical protein